MEIMNKKTLTDLTPESVIIRTRSFMVIDGAETLLKDDNGRSYVNSEMGRAELIATELDDVVAAVFALWGDEPIITPSDSEDGVDENFWDELAKAIEEGVNEV